MGENVRSPRPAGDREPVRESAPDAAVATTTARESWRVGLARVFWGYDFFISYHWESGGAYARALAQRLRDKHYDVFLDRAEYAMGEDWKRVGEAALRNTQRLVLIATLEAVTKSDPVTHEVKSFTARGRRVIPVVFYEDRDTGRVPSLAGLVRTDNEVLALIPDAQLYIDDNAKNLCLGPADDVVDRLVHTFRIMRRRNMRATILGLVALILIAFSGVAMVSWFNAEKERQAAVQAASVAKDQRRTAEKNAADSAAVALATQAVEIQGPTRFPLPRQREQDERATLIALQAYRFHTRGSGLMQPAVDNALRTILGADFFSTVLGEGEAAEFSSDGQRLAVRSKDRVVVWGMPGPASRPIAVLRRGLSAVTFGHGGKTLISGDAAGSVALWDLSRPDVAVHELVGHKSAVTSIRTGPTGRRVASIGSDGTVCVWNVDDRMLTLHHSMKVEGLGVLGFLDSDDRIVYQRGSEFPLTDLSSPQFRETRVVERGAPFAPARVLWLHPYTGYLIVRSEIENALNIYKIFGDEARASPQTSDLDVGPVDSALYSREGSRLFTYTTQRDGKASVAYWQRCTDKPVLTKLLASDEEPLAVSPAGNLLVTKNKNRLRLWRLQPLESPLITPWPTMVVDEAVYAPRHETLIWTDDSGNALFYAKRGNKRVDSVALNRPGVVGRTGALQLSPDGNRAAVSFGQGGVAIVDVSALPDGNVRYKKLAGSADHISFSPDGKRIALACGGAVFLWDGVETSELVSFRPADRATGLHYLKDTGSRLIGIERNGDLIRWSTTTLADGPELLLNVYEVTKHVGVQNESGIPSIIAALSDDGLNLAIAFEDEMPGRVYMCDVGRKVVNFARPTGHEYSVQTLAYADGDRLLCSGGFDGTVQVWRTHSTGGPLILHATNEALGTSDPVRGIENRVFRIALDPSGSQLTALTRMGAISWNMGTKSLADRAAGVVRRNLSWDEWQEYIGPLAPYELTCPHLPSGK